MKQKLKFKGVWRDYQQRILDNLTFHLSDNKIHVVAAPGAGKTTLGIEIISRLNKPTLILAPTITIRNQWKQRIVDAFLEDNDEDILSCDIKNPKFITIITYQALLASFCKGEETEEETEENEIDDCSSEKTITRLDEKKAHNIIEILHKAGISILCFDEAHHLRKEWWKALNYLTDNLETEHTLAFTATPPYDVDYNEWQRYEELCGEIDEIISIPELVRNDDLCPHQDFIYFSTLRDKENEEINKIAKQATEFINSLFENEVLKNKLLEFLENEPPENIYNAPFDYISLASFLNVCKIELPKDFLNIFSINQNEIPPFKKEVQKAFLNFIFKKDSALYQNNSEFFTKLENNARASGIFYKNCIYLNDSPKLKKQVANSTSKLQSIMKIADIEVYSLKKDLRMVILADYIKLEEDTNALGVIPIWNVLKDRKDTAVGVLTGSIILIPKEIKDSLNQKAEELKIKDEISYTEFERDKNYLSVNLKGANKSQIVNLITEAFSEGLLNILIGTQALLGEGWDAPCINSLILSSTITSYMLSNQMRGRAIRKDKNNPYKVANIWHLASIKISTPFEILINSLKQDTENFFTIELFDYEKLEQRFMGFEAPSIKTPYVIENGINRILPNDFIKKYYSNMLITEQDFLNINHFMIANARNRKKTKASWQEALSTPYNQPQKSLKNGVESTVRMKNYYYKAGYFYKLFIASAVSAPMLLTCFAGTSGAFGIYIFFIILAVLMFKPTIQFIRCSSPEKIMRQIGIVIVETLYFMGLIKTSLKTIGIVCKQNPNDNSIFFSISNVTPEENNLVIKSLIEFLNPIENPRYLFMRKDRNIFGLSTTDYHAIPTVIAQQKENALMFSKLWKKYIGNCNIIYTRTLEGRKALLYARKNSFSSLNQTKKSKKMSRFL